MFALRAGLGVSATYDIPGDANIYGAGHLVPPEPSGGGPGSLPPLYALSPGPNQVLTFSASSGCVTMTVSFGSCNGADGSTAVPWASTIDAYGGLSGISHDTNGFLCGVFLDDREPLDPAPPALDFRSTALGTGFTTLAPVIGQVFFTGDGLTGTGTGSVQRFLVPATATRLFLGFADGQGYSGPPGAYGDNDGSLSATFDISCASGPPPADLGNSLRAVHDAAGAPDLSWTDLGGSEADYRIYRGPAKDPVASPPTLLATSGGPDAVRFADSPAPSFAGCLYYKVRGVGPCGEELSTW